jgi:hypothetical protein
VSFVKQLVNAYPCRLPDARGQAKLVAFRLPLLCMSTRQCGAVIEFIGGNKNTEYDLFATLI